MVNKICWIRGRNAYFSFRFMYSGCAKVNEYLMNIHVVQSLSDALLYSHHHLNSWQAAMHAHWSECILWKNAIYLMTSFNFLVKENTYSPSYILSIISLFLFMSINNNPQKLLTWTELQSPMNCNMAFKSFQKIYIRQ